MSLLAAYKRAEFSERNPFGRAAIMNGNIHANTLRVFMRCSRGYNYAKPY